MRVLILLFVLACSACDDPSPSRGAASASVKSSPTADVDGAFKAVQLALDRKITLARMSDGTVRAWGNNDHGLLGFSKRGNDSATPVAVADLTNVTQVIAGGNTSTLTACGLLADGRTRCWGSANAPMPGRKRFVKPGVVGALADIKQMSLGSNGHGCAVMADATVRCWGNNSRGQLGTGDATSSDEPTVVVGLSRIAEVSVGTSHSCARRDSGKVSCWGDNFAGAVNPLSADQQIHTPVELDLAKVEQIAAASSQTCARTADEVHCWGRGYGKRTKLMSALNAPTQLAGRGNNMCVRQQDGTVKCWGDNRWGQIGDGTYQSRREPTRVLDNVVDVAVGERHACAALDDGSVRCWGQNQRGEIGDGSLVDRPSPTLVRDLLQTPLPDPDDGFARTQQHAVPQSWSEVPAACKRDKKLPLRLPRHSADQFDLRAGYARRIGAHIELHLANYHLDPSRLPLDEPRAEQVRFTAMLQRDATKSGRGIALDTGIYDFLKGRTRHAKASLHTRRYAIGLSRGRRDGTSPGSIEITHLDDAWLCGELQLNATERGLTGHFAAAIVSP